MSEKFQERDRKQERGKGYLEVDVADATWQATRRYIKPTASVSSKS